MRNPFKRKPRCEHRWEVVGATYYKPIRGDWSMTGFIDVEPLLYGRTVLTQKCTVCDYVDTTDHVGRVSLPDNMRWRDCHDAAPVRS